MHNTLIPKRGKGGGGKKKNPLVAETTALVTKPPARNVCISLPLRFPAKKM